MPPTRVRWWILTLLFVATTINYLDRIAFGILVPEIRKDMLVDDPTYGRLTLAFEMTYMIGFLIMGKFVQRYGTRIGYTVAVAWWSVAAVLHSIAKTPLELGFWRGMLGLGEAGNFPAAIRSVAEWFPKRDRAFATGIFNAGTNVAAMVGPPVFAYMVAGFGWQGCFLVTGLSGFVWMVIWWFSYRLPADHKGVNDAEQAYIVSDVTSGEAEPMIGWMEALRQKETWGFALGKFLSDPVWRFYSYWLPIYLYDVRGFDMKKVGWVLPVIYLMADIGSVGGGWLSGYLMRRGMAVGKARKVTMLICAACMPVAVCSVLADSPILAIALMSLATAAHQGFSANLYTVVSDVFPRPAVASVTGIGGFAGSLGGVLFATWLPGELIPMVGYKPICLTFGLFHLTGVLALHLLMGQFRPVEAGTTPR